MATSEDDATAQSEELCALEAIYGEEACSVNHPDKHCKILVDAKAEGAPQMTLQVFFPEAYPSSQPPLAQLTAPHLPEDVASWAVKQLEQQFRPGESIVFEWVEWLKAQPELQAPGETVQEPPAGSPTLPSQGPEEVGLDPEELRRQNSLWQQAKVEAKRREAVEGKLVHGEPFTERKSTFQAHLAPVTSVDEVEEVMAVLLANSKVQRATHNMMAYRIASARDTLLQDCDDDGEAAAGGRLLHLLQIVDARDVVVIVSRWYGGILLGPSRFTHINNAARGLLDECGFIAREAAKGKKRGK